MNPAVTILMPAYNAERHLSESIRGVLAQTFRDFELLIVDDGSTDESLAITTAFEDPRVRVIRNETNAGLVGALNRGLAEARGEWIARQDADDRSAPERLAAQVEFARAHPSVPLVGSDARLISGRGDYRGRWRTGGHADLVRWDLCFRTPFAHSSAFFRRSIVIEKFAGYRDLRACEDFDLWSRIARDFPVVTLRRPLVDYRLHETSIMAFEHARGSIAPVAGILRSNLASAAPGLSASDQDVIVDAWAAGSVTDWTRYFRAIGEARRGFLRGRSAPPGFDRLVAEQHYTLLCRRKTRLGRMAVLNGLRRASGRQFAALPWPRVLVALMRT